MRAVRFILLAAASTAASKAAAQELAVKPIADARLRYEHVEQDGLARDADALTARLRAGAEANYGHWSVLVEGEGTLAAIDHYNDGLHGPFDRPLVADPENIELNRAQVRYTVPGKGAVTLGRQRIELLDQRFVGSSGFRQNEQTFDGVRTQWGGKTGLSADVSYVWSVRTINGIDGRAARQQAVSGDNLFALLGYGFPFGTLTGFALLVDQDEAQVQSYRLSSQTYGARFAGTRPIAKDLALAYALSYARQSDYHHNPNDYGSDYYLAEASLKTKSLSGTIGYEVLGADEGAALTSFQTPLSSLFKFQGWADRFTATPPNGIRDLYAGAGYSFKNVGPADTAALSATWHDFHSDRADQHYGSEIDLLASLSIGRYSIAARYARNDADEFATDTSKFWLSAEVAY